MTNEKMIALGLAIYVIKELIGIIKSLANMKTKPVAGSTKTDESELLYRQQMMTQHERMTEALTTCVAVTKSTNEKCEKIKTDVIVIRDRVTSKL